MFAQLGASVEWPVIAGAQSIALPCEYDPQSDELLRCVIALIETVEKKTPTAQAILNDQVLTVLQRLADFQSYRGAASDLNELKRRSTDLKLDPKSNRIAIIALDSAIAAHVDEIGPAVSTQALAKEANVGTDIYPRFVEQKLTFLGDEKKVEFYDRGPFEIVRRTLLANALESSYFLEGQSDKGKLEKEIRILDETLDRLRSPEYDYIERRPQESRINSILFWRASLLFLLGDKIEMKKTLREIILKHQQFDILTKNIGHIYIYKVFDLPYELKVQSRDQDNQPKIEIKDANLLRRYYNPAQLALVACAHLDEAGGHGIQTFMKATAGLVLSDYYVVAASSKKENSRRVVEQFDEALREAINSEKFRGQRDELVKEVADKEVSGLSDAVKNGARLCEIEDSVRNEIYSPFDFGSYIKHVEEPGTHVDYLLFGGRLNATQASVVSNFLSQSVFAVPELQSLRETLGTDNKAYIARMPMDN
jgi:hypothetical protein